MNEEEFYMQTYLLKQVTEKMTMRLAELDVQNIYSIEKEFHAYFTFLKSLIELPCSLTLPEQMESLPDKDTIDTQNKESEIQQALEAALQERPTYRFERKLKGGFVPHLKAIVPEREIRKQGIQHGDLLYAELQHAGDGETLPKYYYSIAQANGGELKDRIELRYCIVEYDDHLKRFVVNKMADGKLIRIDEVPQTIALLESDVREMNISKGDIVDVAYLKSNPLSNRIVWKYSIDDISITHSKAPAKTEKEKREKKGYEQLFQGKTILMLGNEPDKAEFEAAVVNRGGMFLFLSGDEHKNTMTAVLEKADAAIFMLLHVSHDATNWAKEVCKKGSIPFKGIDSFGKGAFVRTVEQLLQNRPVYL